MQAAASLMEQRKHRRFPFEPGRVFARVGRASGRWRAGQAIDFSFGGVCILGERRLYQDDLVQIRLDAGTDSPIRCPRACRVRPFVRRRPLVARLRVLAEHGAGCGSSNGSRHASANRGQVERLAIAIEDLLRSCSCSASAGPDRRSPGRRRLALPNGAIPRPLADRQTEARPTRAAGCRRTLPRRATGHLLPPTRTHRSFGRRS